MKILIVDDEFEMRQLLKLYLTQEGYQVDQAENGRQAYEKLVNIDYNLMILDVMMPLVDGIQTIEQVRRISDIPVIMLTAKGATEDKVEGLSKGADDYLVKPFEEAELMARVQALLRRSQQEGNNEVLKYNGIILNQQAREVQYLNTEIHLTMTEFDLLKELVEHRGKALSREQLVELIWGMEFRGEDRTVDSHVKNLREKLKAAGIDKPIVKTVWGIGYKVE